MCNVFAYILYLSMPHNKNALLRYKVLDRCFQNKGRNFGINDLIHEINKELEDFNGPDVQVNRRMVYYDIDFMKSEQGYSIPLKKIKDGRKVYFRYSDPNFSINNQKITDQELSTIQNALDALSRISGAQQFEWVQEILPKLKDTFNIKSTSKDYISLESNIDLRGIKYLESISEAINKEQVIEIDYKDFRNEEPYTLNFHPYYLKQYNNRWFAFGLNETAQISTWNVPLDRIEKIDYVNTRYIPSDTEWYEYFYDIVGVTRLDKEVEEVVLKFTKEQAPYILTKPIHPTQKTYWLDNSLIVNINVIPNFELNTLILSFGDRVKVLSPNSLGKQIKLITSRMAESYEN